MSAIYMNYVPINGDGTFKGHLSAEARPSSKKGLALNSVIELARHSCSLQITFKLIGYDLMALIRPYRLNLNLNILLTYLCKRLSVCVSIEAKKHRGIGSFPLDDIFWRGNHVGLCRATSFHWDRPFFWS